MPDKHPRVFIGSSSEGRSIAEHLQVALDDVADVTIWDQGIFELTGDTLGSLLQATGMYDFAILVLTGDDLVDKRGKEARAPRDNVVFELGLFLGALGRDRVFIVQEQDTNLSVPTDLAGVTTSRYRRRAPRAPSAEAGPSATKIKDRIASVGTRVVVSPGANERDGTARRSGLRFAADLAAGLYTGAAGVEVRLSNESAQRTWRKTLLGALTQEFVGRAPDCYTMWLAPPGSDGYLAVVLANNLPETEDPSTYKFAADEGLIGQAWARGVEAVHSPIAPHAWWTYRPGCDSETYLCVPLRGPRSRAGMLAVGSTAGFQILDDDLELVRLFAALLSAGVEAEPTRPELDLLRSRLIGLHAILENLPVHRPVGAELKTVFNILLSTAQESRPDDRVLQSLQEVDSGGELDVGQLRALLQLVSTGL